MVRWALVQSRGNASTRKMDFVRFQTKKKLLSLRPWWLDLKAKWYERIPTRTCSTNWQDPESCGAMLEWLGLANPKWIVSWLGPHAHPAHQWCSPDIEPGSYQKCISPNWHTICVVVGFGVPVEYGEVLFPTLVKYQDVFQIHYHEWVGEGPQYISQQPHEGCEGIREPKRHGNPFKNSLLRFEGSLPVMQPTQKIEEEIDKWLQN